MAKIEFDDSDGIRSVVYFTQHECITLEIQDENEAFKCFWTPKLPPLDTVKKLLAIEVIPLKTSKGYIELENSTIETSHWPEALRKVSVLPSPGIQHLRFGTLSRYLKLDESPYDETTLWCGIGGEIAMIGKLGAAVTLTAPFSLIVQYHAMWPRLIGSHF